RWPIEVTPRPIRSSEVRFGSTSSSMSLSRKAASYCPRPRPRSQPAISTFAASMPPLLPLERVAAGKRHAIYNPAENHEMVEPGLPHCSDDGIAEIFGKIDPGNLGAQCPGDRAEVKRTIGHVFIIF